MNDPLDIVHVQAPGGQVACHHHLQATLVEALHDRLALLGGQFAVQAGSAHAGGLQQFCQARRGGALVGKNQLSAAAARGQCLQQLILVALAVRQDPLVDDAGRQATGDVQGVPLQRFADRRHPVVVEGGGEQQGLALRRAGLGQSHDVLAKAHFQHAIRLVQDQDAHLGQQQAAAAQVVDQAPGGADQQLRVAAQQGLLEAEVGAAGEGLRAQAGLGQQLAGLLEHLAGQFAGWYQHQDQGALRLTGQVAEQELQGRQQVGQGLAAAGGGADAQVATGEGRRQHRGLYLGGAFKALFLESQ